MKQGKKIKSFRLCLTYRNDKFHSVEEKYTKAKADEMEEYCRQIAEGEIRSLRFDGVSHLPGQTHGIKYYFPADVLKNSILEINYFYEQ